MSECGQYRRLLAALLLWALVPLPFTYIVLPPFWLAAAAAAAHLLVRPASPMRLSTASQNVLAVLILIAVVLAGGVRVGPLRPLGHLLLLLTATRIVTVDSRRSFLRALPAVLLVWVVAVTSSTHVTLVAYLAMSAGVLWWAGMRIILVGLGTEVGHPLAALQGYPRAHHAALAAACALILAVPVFVAMPRLRSPWVAAGGGGLRAVSGFSLAVELAQLGQIKRSAEVALVLRAVHDDALERAWARLRGTAFDLVRTGLWSARTSDLHDPEVRDGLVWLRPEVASLDKTVELEIELRTPERYLFLPPGAAALRCPAPAAVDPAGGVVLTRRIDAPLTYRVWVVRQPLPHREEPTRRDLFLPHRNPEVAELARQAAGDSDDNAMRARAIASFLEGNYRYSLEGPPRFQPDPVAWFLLEGRRGHCEFFAGSMVVLLRSLGVPARMVGGYSGGTLDPGGREVVVRQSEAHTWVEVWLGEGRGWAVFDPTPAEGVPALSGLTGMDRVRWVWERVQSLWDRYVLTFGLGEQLGLISAAGELVSWLASRLRWHHSVWLVGLGVIVVLAGRLWRWLARVIRCRRSGRERAAADVVARIERRLEAAGVAVPAGATVRWIAGAAVRRWPSAAPPLAELVPLAEAELYAPEGAPAHARSAARRLWTELRRGVEK